MAKNKSMTLNGHAYLISHHKDKGGVGGSLDSREGWRLDGIILGLKPGIHVPVNV
jgi:hypothetical protein